MNILNRLIIKTMPLIPKSIIHQVAKKYIAGDILADAVRVTKDLEKIGGMSTIDVLGEFVTTRDRALYEMSMSIKVLDAIYDNSLQSYLSLKPTSLGLGIDEDFAFNNIQQVIRRAAAYNIFVRLDMENSPFTSKTIKLYKRLRESGLNNVGIVIQAYLFRSEDDIRSLLTYKPSIRLCKGIYREDASIAFQDKEDIRRNYEKLLILILKNELKIGIATHDEPLINFAREYISENGIKKEDYEFQMLLGVREERRNELLKEGHKLRVYVPFGEDWYGYSTRRLKENPQIAGHIFKSIFIKD